jgi:cell division protein FtsI/penicillin-binding protein 2
MRWLSSGSFRFERKRIKLALLAGLSLGIVFSATLSGQKNPAAGKEAVTAADSFSPLSTLLTQGIEKAGRVVTPKVEEVPELDPASFLDESIDLLSRMTEGKEQTATVQLANGLDLEFTILPELQAEVEKVYRQFKPERAAFVAIDPATGEVLALTGFHGGEIVPHEALMAHGPAASVFKIVTAAALVEARGISPTKQVCFHGGSGGVSRYMLTADPEHDTTCYSLSEAIGHSANVVFARLANQNLSRAEMKRFAERFGFNQAIPFLWPVELSKIDVPEDRLEFARMAAGFYHTTLSPFHGALMAAAVANQGKMMRPQILSRVTKEGEVVYRHKPRKLFDVLEKETASTLARMMVTTTVKGTARKYFRKLKGNMVGLEVAGKTGSLSKKGKGEPSHYSWFVGFAPADHPQVAFASLVVNGPQWRVKGPFVARKALDSYFEHFPPQPETAKR